MIRLDELLRAVADGRLWPADARERPRESIVEDPGLAHVVHMRVVTRGAPEMVFGQGRDPKQIVAIVAGLHSAGGGFLAARLVPEAQETFRDAFTPVETNQAARTAS